MEKNSQHTLIAHKKIHPPRKNTKLLPMKWTNCVCRRVWRQKPVFLAGSCRAESRMGTMAWISGFLQYQKIGSGFKFLTEESMLSLAQLHWKLGSVLVEIRLNFLWKLSLIFQEKVRHNLFSFSIIHGQSLAVQCIKNPLIPRRNLAQSPEKLGAQSLN